MAGRKKSGVAGRVLADLQKFTLCNHDGRAFMIIGNQALEIGTGQFKEYVSRYAYREMSLTLSEGQMKEIIPALRGAALYDAPTKPVFVRTAYSTEKKVFYDLCDTENTIIEIDGDGWREVKNPDVYFFRPSHLKKLPKPDRRGKIDDLKIVMNFKEKNDYVLTRSTALFWMRGRPGERGTLPGLNLTGPPGGGKTTRAKILKYIYDPATPETRTITKEARDVFVSAKNQFLLCFDNISYIDPEISDALCSLQSGGGFAKRKNYSDDDESVIEECRGIILNGITFKTRADLQSRIFTIELSAINSKERRTEKDIWAQVEIFRPSILGGSFTALSGALREVDSIDPAAYELPRLADFALFSLAAEKGNKWKIGETITAMKENYEIALNSISDSGPIAHEIKNYISLCNNQKWEGTAAQLLTELEAHAGKETQKKKTWPGSPEKLAGDIMRNVDVLQNMGIAVTKARTAKGRIIKIECIDAVGNGKALQGKDIDPLWKNAIPI